MDAVTRERDASDAPVHYSAQEAEAWAAGFNTALAMPPAQGVWTPPSDRPDGYRCLGWVDGQWVTVVWVKLAYETQTGSRYCWVIRPHGRAIVYPTDFATLPPAPEASHDR